MPLPAVAELTLQGTYVELGSGYQVPAEGIFLSDNAIVPGSTVAQASVLSQNNSAAGFASMGSVWVNASAVSVPADPFNISQAGGEARALVINLSGGPLVIEGLYGVKGNGTVTSPITSNDSDSFSFTLAPNEQWLARVTAKASGDSQPIVGPRVPSSSSSLVFTSRRPDEAPKPLPGSSEFDYLANMSGTPGQEKRRDYLDSREKGIDPGKAIEPQQVTGARLTSPIINSYGQSDPIFVGPNSEDSPAVPLSSLAEGMAAFSESPPAALIDPDDLIFQFPSAVVAYRYTVTENLFTHFILPEALPGGDSTLQIEIGSNIYPYTPGVLFDFTQYVPGGINEFFLSGIDIDEDFQADETAPFVSGMQFAENGVANIAISFADVVIFVPEPGGIVILMLGIVFATCQRRKPQKLAISFKF